MDVLNAYLNSYWDYAMLALALILLFGIIKVFLIWFQALRKNMKRNAFKF